MAKVTYIAFLEATDDGYGVSFPDLEGCISWGADQTQALENAREALSLHLEGMAEEGLEIPSPSDLKAVARRLAEAYVERREPTVYVGVEVKAPEAAERVNVYLNKGLLDRMDRHARRRGVNRSEFIALAARHYMGEPSKGGASHFPGDADTEGWVEHPPILQE
ncbi:MAG: type II toxin-antitoxin system HicB family antitoxin [Phenylobacterium sp.]|uniref:type II toxin-antitoxin system HicB family antitoxin n=1 Tax=Phenylobacterium sp. TaxID=1871053 RepID=UPI001A6133D9|nr:type II toxin-antitoxin system HicB family antitoxin [Phenylobacterium sp.]MBL8773742.1 type II toxin-antitoxin system HicB family antitoxin [Phenylobacterium sp.]